MYYVHKGSIVHHKEFFISEIFLNVQHFYPICKVIWKENLIFIQNLNLQY